MLGAISLDLFAVLFGGAVALAAALCPRRSCTPARSASASCAARRRSARSSPGSCSPGGPLRGSTGVTLLAVVAAFGVAMIVFGLSRSFPLSLAALAVSGFVDMISVNIRSTIPAVAAPNELRGRVVAVEMVFIRASNELGAFESGVVAALIGAVPAVVIGGAITIVLAASGAGSSPTWRGSTGSTSSGPNRRERPRRLCRVRSPMATIRIPPILRPEAGGNREVEASGRDRARRCSRTSSRPTPRCTSGSSTGDELPQFLNVFVDGSDVRLLDGLDTAVSDSTTVILLPAVAGGAGPPDAEAEPFALGDDGVAVLRGSVPTERCGPNAAVAVGGAAREVRVAVDDAARI